MSMQPGPEVHPSRVPPPSYEEAIGQAVAAKDNEYIPPTGQTYDQYQQTSSYLPSISTYQQQSNFYSTNTQPQYGTPYVSTLAVQQTGSTAHCVVQCERHKRQWKTRYCGKRLAAAVTVFILCLIVIKVVVAHVI